MWRTPMNYRCGAPPRSYDFINEAFNFQRTEFVDNCWDAVSDGVLECFAGSALDMFRLVLDLAVSSLRVYKPTLT